MNGGILSAARWVRPGRGKALLPVRGTRCLALLLVVLAVLVARSQGPLPPDTSGLLDAIRGTLFRLSVGLALGGVAGVLLGAAMGLSRVLEQVLGSLIHPLRQIPLFGWIPLIGLCFGLGEGARLSFVVLAVSYVMVVAAQQAVANVSPAQRELARVLQLSAGKQWFALILPAALPGLFAGLRVALASAWGASIGSEILMTGGPGLGAWLWSARELGRSDYLVAGTLVIVLLGLASNALLRVIEAKSLPWLALASTRGAR